MNDHAKRAAGAFRLSVLVGWLMWPAGPPLPASAPYWRPVGSWAGSGGRTLQFATGDEWRLTCRAAGAAAVLTLHSPHHATETVLVPPGREKAQAFDGRPGAHVVEVAGATFGVTVEELQP